MKTAAAQMQVGLDKTENLRKIASMAALAAKQGAELVLFPEACMYNYGTQTHLLLPHAEPLDGPFVTALGRIAKDNGVFVVAGMFEAIPGEQLVYNTVVAIDSNGELVGHYRKIHLYDAFGWKESERIKAGDGATLIFHCGDIKCGVMTCYDVRFPELARHLALSGVDVILLPAAWVAGPLKEMHLETLVRARAIENNLYVASAVQTGGTYCGDSRIVDPSGEVLAVNADEGVIVADIASDTIAAVREKSPTLRNRRPKLYSQWSE
jgi:predicted amidohydrolase